MIRALTIGGSAGSFHTITGILKSIPESFNIPVFLCLHRLKQIRTGFVETLGVNSKIPLLEPDDKTMIQNGVAYLAPANYHMMIEKDYSISLAIDEPIHHSRPSIDLCFSSAADTYGDQLAGILLSGANIDGTRGMIELRKNKSFCVIQDPSDCEIQTMCYSALQQTKPEKLLTSEQIIEFVSLLNNTE